MFWHEFSANLNKDVSAEDLYMPFCHSLISDWQWLVLYKKKLLNASLVLFAWNSLRNQWFCHVCTLTVIMPGKAGEETRIWSHYNLSWVQAGFESELTAAGSIAETCLEPAGYFAAKQILKPHLHALKNRYGTPNFWHRADDFKAQHSQFSMCKRIGPKCIVAPVLKILDYLWKVVSAWAN